MREPGWRTIPAGMVSTEYADWHRPYRMHYLQDTRLDMHFSELTYAVLNLFLYDLDVHPPDFSLFVPRHEEEQVGGPDEGKMLMQRAAGLIGDARFGGDGGRDILPSTDVVGVMVDDAALMMASAGIPGDVRYAPAG